MTFCIVTACIVQALPQLYRIMTCDAARMPKRERGHKETGPAAVARHVLLVVACMAAGIVWLMDPGRGPGEVRYVYVAYGVSYAWVACELIMAHMAKEPFRPPALPTALLLAGAANGWLGPFVPRPTAAVAVSAAVVLLFLHYVVTTIRDICAFLDIPCLTIRPKSAAAQR